MEDREELVAHIRYIEVDLEGAIRIHDFFIRTLVVSDVTPIKTNYICSDSICKQSHVL